LGENIRIIQRHCSLDIAGISMCIIHNFFIRRCARRHRSTSLGWTSCYIHNFIPQWICSSLL